MKVQHKLAIAILLIGSAMNACADILDDDLESKGFDDVQRLEAALRAKADMGPGLGSDDPFPPIIKDSEAVDHIGETVEVRGIVSDVRTSKRGIFIYLGGKTPDQLCTGFIPAAYKLTPNSAFLKMLEGTEIGICGEVKLSQAKPAIKVFLPRAQIMIKWKTAEEDPINYLNGVVNDLYRSQLGLSQPLSKKELQKFKAYLDQNVKNWQDGENWEDKDGEDLYKLVPKFLQTTSAATK